MADTVQSLVDDVLNEGSFDATSAQALRWLNLRHRKMVARARCYRKTATLSVTATAGEYTLPSDLIEVLEVQADGIAYGAGRHRDISAQAQGLLWLEGTGGVYTGEEDTTGGRTITLIPDPGSTSVVSVRGAFLPPDLLVADDTTLKIDPMFVEALVAGAIATGLSRAPGDFRADLAASFEQQFTDGSEEHRRVTDRRYRGVGPAQIRVAGYNY